MGIYIERETWEIGVYYKALRGGIYVGMAERVIIRHLCVSYK